MWGFNQDSTIAIHGTSSVKCSSIKHVSLYFDLLYALGVIAWMFIVKHVDEGLLGGCIDLCLVFVGIKLNLYTSWCTGIELLRDVSF